MEYVCPVCEAKLYAYDALFLKDGEVVGCEKCYAENDVLANEMMPVCNYLDPEFHYFPEKIN